MKYLYSLLLVSITTASLFAQDISSTSYMDEQAILAPVHRLFTAMAAHDTAVLRSAFMPDAYLETVYEKDGQVVIHKTTLDEFISNLSMAEGHQLYEHLWSYEVVQNGALATVWTPYSFYLDGQVSHCGANAFQLVRYNHEGWLIRHIIDTRRKQPCPMVEQEDLIGGE